MKTFVQSQFGYCPLVWRFHNREVNTRINKIHEIALRMVYDDYESSFSVLLNKDKSFTIHERNIQTMAIEMYKVFKGLAPDIMKYVFPMKQNILYCSKQVFQTRNVLKHFPSWDRKFGL